MTKTYKNRLEGVICTLPGSAYDSPSYRNYPYTGEKIEPRPVTVKAIQEKPTPVCVVPKKTVKPKKEPKRSKNWRKKIESQKGFSQSDWLAIVTHYGQCLKCERDDVQLVADHIIPLYRDGKDHRSNIQPLCGSCNLKKGLQIIDYRVSYPRLDFTSPS